MDQTQLKNFVLLAQTLNYSAVAKQEFISQPALTKQINRLEEELGVRLFHRTKHGVSLTYAGEEFYSHAVCILDDIEKAVHHMENIRQGQTGSLKISAIYSLEDELARYAESFVARYPEVNVSVTSGTGSQQTLSLNNQAADLYFSFSPLLALYPGLDAIPLSEDRFSVYVCEREAERLRKDGLTVHGHGFLHPGGHWASIGTYRLLSFQFHDPHRGESGHGLCHPALHDELRNLSGWDCEYSAGHSGGADRAGSWVAPKQQEFCDHALRGIAS